MKTQYQVELVANVTVMVWLEADSDEQAKDMAAQWRPNDSGCHTVKNYFADSSTDNGDLVELPEGVDLEWELLNTDVEKTTVQRSEAHS